MRLLAVFEVSEEFFDLIDLVERDLDDHFVKVGDVLFAAESFKRMVLDVQGVCGRPPLVEVVRFAVQVFANAFEVLTFDRDDVVVEQIPRCGPRNTELYELRVRILDAADSKNTF